MAAFLFVLTNHDNIIPCMFRDLMLREDVQSIPTMLPFSGKMNGLISDGLNRFSDSVFWQRMTGFVEERFSPLPEDRDFDFLIFTNSTLRGVSTSYLRGYLNRHPQCIPVLLFLDHSEQYMARYAMKVLSQFPSFRCLSFDPKDAIKFGWPHIMQVYSKLPLEQSEKRSDVYFSFSRKERLPEVKKTAAYLAAHGFSMDLLFAEPGHFSEEELGPHIRHSASRLPYEKILKGVAASDCLLEILKEGQTGVTLRYYEAICYNKKLLTTNRLIQELPFYDPRFMQVFQEPSDIDIDWLHDPVPVDYHYDGRFSPAHIPELLNASFSAAAACSETAGS